MAWPKLSRILNQMLKQMYELTNKDILVYGRDLIYAGLRNNSSMSFSSQLWVKVFMRCLWFSTSSPSSASSTTRCRPAADNSEHILVLGFFCNQNCASVSVLQMKWVCLDCVLQMWQRRRELQRHKADAPVASSFSLQRQQQGDNSLQNQSLKDASIYYMTARWWYFPRFKNSY